LENSSGQLSVAIVYAIRNTKPADLPSAETGLESDGACAEQKNPEEGKLLQQHLAGTAGSGDQRLVTIWEGDLDVSRWWFDLVANDNKSSQTLLSAGDNFQNTVSTYYIRVALKSFKVAR
jgi:hypothetical protein